MPKRLLSVPHRQQQADGDCLAVSRGDFELAWLERDYAFALIQQPGL
jgi:hypothetical protein